MYSQEYWPEVRAMREELQANHPSGTVYLTLKANGRVLAASIEIAARCLVDATHTISTEAEITGHREIQKLEAERGRAIEMRHRSERRHDLVPVRGL